LKRLLAAWLVACCLISVAAAAAGVLTPDTTAYDFGALLGGEVVTHTFMLTNAGDATVTVSNLQASCPCTKPSMKTTVLAPKATAPLLAQFSSWGFNGSVSKTITVTYTSPGGPRTQQLHLTIHATVVEADSAYVATGKLDLDLTLLIDLRSSQAYAARHLIGALSIPYDQLASWAGLLPRGVFTILYDQSGTVAATAARTLRNAGYPDVQYLQGGLDAWTKAYPNRFLTAGAAVAERFLLPSGAGGPGVASALKGVDASYLKRNYLVLVDLRSQEAYAAAHCAGAANVAPAELLSWAAGLPKDARVILYDEDGTTARVQALALRNARYGNAQSLFGGMAQWREAFGDKGLVASVIP